MDHITELMRVTMEQIDAAMKEREDGTEGVPVDVDNLPDV